VVHTIGPDAGGFFSRLFSADFIPRTHCFREDAAVVWLHLISDTVITLAYYSIPVALVTLVFRRRDLAFHWMFLLFGGFILLCGTTHFFNLLALTTPMYRLDGVVKALTALFSIGTAAVLWPLIPRVLALPSPTQLRALNTELSSEVEQRRKAQMDLERSRHELEERVEQRTAELAGANEMLRREIAERTAAEERVRTLNQGLEVEVDRRTRELEETHQRMRMSERMAAIGTLSAGLGHDMGNLLLPVRARLDVVESHDLLPEVREDLASVRRCADYLTRLASGLRLLSLDPEDERPGETDTDVVEWWREAGALMEAGLPRGVQLEADIPEGLPRVRLARHALLQAVFNLVQNAGDVMRARGSGLVRLVARADGEWVTLRVEDNGPGMSPQVAARCFEPFFTTKTRAISTGLGLPLVRAIMSRCGGQVSVESELGRGATFTLRVPSAKPGRAGATVVALLSIADQRIAGYVGAMLQSRGITVAARGPRAAPEQDATLWITNAVSAEAVGAFAARPGSHVIVLGGDPAVATERVTVLPDASKTARLRDAIDAAVRAITGA
jgi:signal transduction histidine kinase